MRNSRSFILVSLCCAAFLCILSGCRASKPTSSISPAENQVKNYPKTAEGEVEAMIDSYKTWSDVTMSFRCNLRSPKSISVSGKATMIRGSEIKLSLRMLGFEVAGLYANSDSIYVYEKLNHTMIVESMDRLTAATGLDINGVQDLLLGHITNPTDRSNSTAGFKITSDDNNILLTLKGRGYNMTYTLLRGEVCSLSALDVEAPGKGQAACKYSAPYLTEAGPVSPTADFNAKFGKISVEAALSWSLETASWNKGLQPSPNLPKGYRRITATQLVKSLGTF